VLKLERLIIELYNILKDFEFLLEDFLKIILLLVVKYLGFHSSFFFLP
jgi:hypothetical protein